MWGPFFLALHIPDGFLSLPVSVVGWLAMIGFVGFALQRTRNRLGERQIPLIGVLAAFIFAAQMINFPVMGGTSGHLLGGALAAILLGPWAGVLVMASVVAVQALLFQDGGLLALGFNTVNMGVLTAFVGYALYALLRQALGTSSRAASVAAGVAAWVTVEVAAVATALELAISGTSPLSVGLPAMAGVHALIGLGEALITAGAVAFLHRTRPDLLPGTHSEPTSGSGWIAAGLVIALAVAFASPLADSSPDGLERVAEDHAFIDKAEDAPYELLPDYTVPGISHEAATTIAAGVLGVAIVAVVSYGAARINRRSSAV